MEDHDALAAEHIPSDASGNEQLSSLHDVEVVTKKYMHYLFSLLK